MGQQAFFYVPFEHQEDLLAQVASVALFEARVGRCEAGSSEREFVDVGVSASVRHRDAIALFGRFPSRNKVLGRQSTPEELEFLKTHPLGF